MLSPWLIGFLVFVLFPMVASLVIGMYRTDFLTSWEFVGLYYYKSRQTDVLVRKALLNTAYFSLVSVPLSTLLALSIAVMLNQGIRGRAFGVQSTICPRSYPAWRWRCCGVGSTSRRWVCSIRCCED